MITFSEIGQVFNNHDSHVECLKLKDSISEIIIHDEFITGLQDIEKNEYLQILFKFHLCNDNYDLLDNTYNGNPTGIFSSRSMGRPNNIGLTTVKLIERNGNRLIVKGLDALNGSPILDIKPYNSILDLNQECVM